MKAISEGPAGRKRKQRRRRRPGVGVRRRGRVKDQPAATICLVSDAALGRLIETVEQLTGVLDGFEDRASGPPPSPE